MLGMDVVRLDSVNYDDISDSVRRFVAERLYELEKSLRPLVDGTFGEVLPGHLAAYLAALRQLGKLYQAEKPPRDLEETIPRSKVQEILAGREAAHQAALSAAVSEAENRIRAELMLGSKQSVSAAKATVSSKLLELETRRPG